MPRLMIRHQPDDLGTRFEVQRVDHRGAKSAKAVTVPDPLALPLEGTDLSLGAELAWYLESYLDYPFGPNQTRAQRVLEALGNWGREAFDTLFGHGQAGQFYWDATRKGHEYLQLVIASDDPHVLSWPWEVLKDPQVGDLAHHARIERQLDQIGDPLDLPGNLSREHVGILLVTARPYEDDIAYRSISRPLVELIGQQELPARVKVLRPPTLGALRAELKARSGAYHIVHFDGHGGFGQVSAEPGKFRGPQGQLMFEQDDGSAAPVTAAQLSQLLREHRIPIVVLNACQSAMLSAEADDAFASVATALLKAGVRSVMAMGYSIYVTAAQQFLPAFYRCLFESGSVAEATRAGRQALLADPKRRGEIELEDWLVPVLYQQDALELDFAARARTEGEDLSKAVIPEDARVTASDAPHGVIGRDSAVLALERASRRAPAGLLLHGLGGVGKTTLARGYIEWLAYTQGLPEKVIWQSMTEVRSFDYLRNRLVEELFGTNAMALPDEQKWPALLDKLKAHAVLIVWDNFESASGTADAGGGGLEAMPPEDRQALKQFLEALRAGPTKVLITSRSDETWLGTTACYRIPLGGLRGEERQALARAILADQGQRLAKDQDAADLIDALEGHPLMMRAILPRLAGTPARKLCQDFERYVPEADSPDPVEQRLYAALRFVEEGLPAALKPLLTPIGLHEGYVNALLLVAMADHAQQAFTPHETTQTLERLEVAGLVRGIGNMIFEMHPALPRYLRARAGQQPDEHQGAWEAAFVEIMARFADGFSRQQLLVQRQVFSLNGQSFEHALRLAKIIDDLDGYGALTQLRAFFALNRRDLPMARKDFESYANNCEQRKRVDLAAKAHYQLGVVDFELGEYSSANAWISKSLAYAQTHSDDLSAGCYHLRGLVAMKKNDFDAAASYALTAQEIFKRTGDEQGLASSLNLYSEACRMKGDLVSAETSLGTSETLAQEVDDEVRLAEVYFSRGTAAAGQGDVTAAKGFYDKSLAMYMKLGDGYREAIATRALGELATKQGDFVTAENRYVESLKNFERLCDEIEVAITYHELGILAFEKGDYDSADAWYRRSLEIVNRRNNDYWIALNNEKLGDLGIKHGDFDMSEAFYRFAAEKFAGVGKRDDSSRALAKLLEVDSLRTAGLLQALQERGLDVDLLRPSPED